MGCLEQDYTEFGGIRYKEPLMSMIKRLNITVGEELRFVKNGEIALRHLKSGKKKMDMLKILLYFDRLCGEDIEAIEEELQDQNKYVLTPEISSAFQCMLAARAAKIPADAIRRMKIKDYMAIKNKARNFLISMG